MDAVTLRLQLAIPLRVAPCAGMAGPPALPDRETAGAGPCDSRGVVVSLTLTLDV